MPTLTTRLHPVGTTVVGLILVSVLVLVIRSPSDAPQTMDATERPPEGQLMEATAAPDTNSSSQPPAGTAAESSAETSEPPLSDGCFRTGSSRAEVRAVMGDPDTVDFGAWIYGQSYVTFGYGVVLDYRNEGDLRMCP